MSYRLERNKRGFYELDGCETTLQVRQEGVVITTHNDNPFIAHFSIGENHFRIEGALAETGIWDISKVTIGDEGEITASETLAFLDIPKDHPVTKFIFVGGVSLHDEPFEA